MSIVVVSMKHTMAKTVSFSVGSDCVTNEYVQDWHDDEDEGEDLFEEVDEVPVSEVVEDTEVEALVLEDVVSDVQEARGQAVFFLEESNQSFVGHRLYLSVALAD